MRRTLVFFGILTAAWTSAQDPLQVKTPYVAQKRWALVIGASKYTHFGVLNYAASDARDFGKSLVDAYSFRDKDVHMLVDDDPRRLAPTAANVLRELDRILADRALAKGDLFIFYFSGHGVGTAKGDYLVPTDATKDNFESKSLPIKDVIGRFVKAGLKNVLIICDACRAGKENPFGNELQALGKRTNIAVILGCAPGQRSYEYPQLGHGIFTHMLTRAMRSTELRDPQTGALWASAIAKKVREDVSSYTERDYGDDKQVPSVWGEGSTYDVLIGAYIGTDQFAQVGMAEVLKLGHTMDKAAFKLYLRALGQLYFAEHMFEKAVEAYKALEQLGEASPDELYALASSLNSIGRDNEAERIFERIVRENGDTLAADIAVLAMDSRKTSPDRRRQAGRNVWLDSPDWTNSYVYWSIISWQDPVSAADRQVILGELLKQFGEESRIGHYFKATDHYQSGDLGAAVNELGKMLKIEGEEPETQDAYVLYYMISDKLKDEDLIDKIIAQGKRNPKYTAYWEALESSRLDRKSGEARLKRIKERLGAGASAEELLDLAVASGSSAGELLNQFKAAATKHPFAWEAHLAVWLCTEAAKGFPFPPSALDPNIRKYSDSELDTKRSVTESLLALLENANTPEAHLLKFKRYFFSDAVKDAPKYGDKWGLWMGLQSLGFDLDRYLQLGQVARLHLAPAVKAHPNIIPLKELLLDFYIGAGMETEAEALFKTGGWQGVEARGGDLRWAIHLATAGRNKEAKALLREIPVNEQKTLKEMRRALELLLEIRIGDAATALKQLKDFAPDNVVAKQIKTLAEADGFKPKSSVASQEDLLALLPVVMAMPEACSTSNNLYRDVLAACFYRMMQISQYLGLQKGYTLDDTVVAISRENLGNPLFSKMHFGQKAALTDFVGTYTFKGEFLQDSVEQPIPGTVQVKISPDGKVEMVVAGPGNATYRGTVDAQGNVRASRTGSPLKATATCKLAPVGYSSEATQSIPIRIAFVGENGDYLEFREAKGT